MAKDKVFDKQLEALGIEYTQVVPVPVTEKFAEEDRLNTSHVIRTLMEDPGGRQWVYAQLDRCRVFTTPFIPGQPDTTAFQSGAQAYGQALLADIMVSSPENFWKMISEDGARRAARANTPK